MSLLQERDDRGGSGRIRVEDEHMVDCGHVWSFRFSRITRGGRRAIRRTTRRRPAAGGASIG